MSRLIRSLIALSFSSLILAQQVQKPRLQLPPSASASRDQARTVFSDAFSAYLKFAAGHDDLSPVSKGFSDTRNGWGASIVDGLGTMKIMGLEDLFQFGVNFSTNIDFSQSKTPDTVSVFESTIRYVGGLLSAYELNGKKPQALVDKAKQLADKLALGFAGGSPIPYPFVDFSTNSPVQQSSSNIASAGTLTLEWATLSKYTKDTKYRQLAEGAAKHIASLTAPLPGLAAQGINPSTGEAIGGYVTWGGGSDSYFEYLLKYPRLTLDTDPIFLRTWQTAVDSSIKYLLKESYTNNWSYLADMTDDRKIRHISSHLGCFHGGNWILGGKLLNNQTIVDIGLKLTDACWNTYASTSTGIGPEVFAFTSKVNGQPPNGSDDGTYTGRNITASELDFNTRHGFYIFDGYADYILRPEVLESNFYAWRVSGDTKYIENAQSYMRSLLKFLKVPGGEGGVSGIDDVNNGNSTRIDDTESFFFAEVMKYLYLTFDDPEHISLDKYVFNTEAQVFEAPPITGHMAWDNNVPSTPTSFNPSRTTAAALPEVSPEKGLPTPLSSIPATP